MKVLISGGSGFIGTNLVDFLVESGENHVVNIDIEPPQKKSHVSLWIKCDIRDQESLNRIIINENPDFLIHLAAQTDLNENEGLDYYSTNIIGVKNIVDSVIACKSIKRVIFTSSMLVNSVGYMPKHSFDYNPTTLYGKSKQAGEEIVFKEKDKLPSFCIVRPTSIWGEWFRAPYRNFFDFVLSRRYFHISNKSCTKTYGYVGNTVNQIIKILHAPTEMIDKQVFYLGDEPALNIKRWANDISKIANLPKPITLPWWLLKIGGFLGDGLKILGITFPLTSFRLKNMTTDNIICLTNTNRVCGDGTFSQNDAIRRTLNWLKDAGV